MATKRFKAMEFLWAAIAIFTLVSGIKILYQNGLEKSYPLFIICAVATGMFFFRRWYGKKIQENNPDQ